MLHQFYIYQYRLKNKIHVAIFDYMDWGKDYDDFPTKVVFDSLSFVSIMKLR